MNTETALKNIARLKAVEKFGNHVDIIDWVQNTTGMVDAAVNNKEVSDGIYEIVCEEGYYHREGIFDNGIKYRFSCDSVFGASMKIDLAVIKSGYLKDISDDSIFKLLSCFSSNLRISLDTILQELIGKPSMLSEEFKVFISSLNIPRASYGKVCFSGFDFDFTFDSRNANIPSVVYFIEKPLFLNVGGNHSIILDNLQCGCTTLDSVPVMFLEKPIVANTPFTEFTLGFTKFFNQNVTFLPSNILYRADSEGTSAQIKGYKYDIFELSYDYDSFIERADRKHNPEISDICITSDEVLKLYDFSLVKDTLFMSDTDDVCIIDKKKVTVTFKNIDLDERFIVNYAISFMLASKEMNIHSMYYRRFYTPEVRVEGTDTPEVWESVISLMKKFNGKLICC